MSKHAYSNLIADICHKKISLCVKVILFLHEYKELGLALTCPLQAKKMNSPRIRWVDEQVDRLCKETR